MNAVEHAKTLRRKLGMNTSAKGHSNIVDEAAAMIPAEECILAQDDRLCIFSNLDSTRLLKIQDAVKQVMQVFQSGAARCVRTIDCELAACCITIPGILHF